MSGPAITASNRIGKYTGLPAMWNTKTSASGMRTAGANRIDRAIDHGGVETEQEAAQRRDGGDQHHAKRALPAAAQVFHCEHSGLPTRDVRPILRAATRGAG